MVAVLQRSGQLRITIDGPFDFALTVAKPAGWNWSTPTETFEDGVMLCAARIGETAVGLKLSSPGPGRVSATLYTGSTLTEELRHEARSALEFGLGKGQDLAGFYRFAARDEILRKTVRDIYGMRVGRMDELFGRIILAICLQMAPLKRSREMMDGVLRNYGEEVAFEGVRMILWPPRIPRGAADRSREVPHRQPHGHPRAGRHARRASH
jgi:hypothetical protein